MANIARNARFVLPTRAYRRPIADLTPTLEASSHFTAFNAGETTNAVNRTPPSHAPAKRTWIVCTTEISAVPPILSLFK